MVAPQIADISGLQHRLDFWELLSHVAQLVVFIGVLGELLAEFTDVFKTQNDEKRKKAFTVAFSLVLLTGLAGEFEATRRTSRINTEITAILRNDIAVAFQNAGQAGVDAANANLEAANTNKRAKELEAENLNLKIELEKERTARAKISAAIAPRRLTPEQQKEITEAVRPFAKPGIKIEVQYTLGTGRLLGTQVWNILRDAGFDVSDRPFGLGWYELAMSGPMEHRDAEEAIVRALMQKGHLPMEGFIQITPPGSPIVLTIGERSQGELPK